MSRSLRTRFDRIGHLWPRLRNFFEIKYSTFRSQFQSKGADKARTTLRRNEDTNGEFGGASSSTTGLAAAITPQVDDVLASHDRGRHCPNSSRSQMRQQVTVRRCAIVAEPRTFLQNWKSMLRTLSTFVVVLSSYTYMLCPT